VRVLQIGTVTVLLKQNPHPTFSRVTGRRSRTDESRMNLLMDISEAES
jgi:hypothetical protein